MDFDGKRCIVTGAAMGIGRAVAEELLERGARCIIADINWKVSDKQWKLSCTENTFLISNQINYIQLQQHISRMSDPVNNVSI